LVFDWPDTTAPQADMKIKATLAAASEQLRRVGEAMMDYSADFAVEFGKGVNKIGEAEQRGSRHRARLRVTPKLPKAHNMPPNARRPSSGPVTVASPNKAIGPTFKYPMLQNKSLDSSASHLGLPESSLRMNSPLGALKECRQKDGFRDHRSRPL